jgi:hypothetical protein
MAIQDFISKNINYFKSAIGDLKDIHVKDDYASYEKFLKDYADKYSQYQIYKNLRSRIGSLSLTPDEVNYLQTQNLVDVSNPELKNSEAYQKYIEANPVKRNMITGKPEQIDANSFNDFLRANYSTDGEINPDYQKFITKQNIALTPDAYHDALMKKAQLTPEEQKAYEKWRGYDPVLHNKQLNDFILTAYPHLVSSGTSGSKYADLLSKKFKMYELVPPDNKGFTPPAPEKKKEDKPFKLSKDAEIRQLKDTNGNLIQQWGYFEPDPKASDHGYTGWKYTGISAEDPNADDNSSTSSSKKKTGGFRRSKFGSTGLFGSDQDLFKQATEYAKNSSDFDKSFGEWDNNATEDKKKAQDMLSSQRDALLKAGVPENELDQFLSDYRSGKKSNKSRFQKNIQTAKEDAGNLKEAADKLLYKDKYYNDQTIDQWVGTLSQAQSEKEFNDWWKQMQDSIGNDIKNVDKKVGEQIWSHIQKKAAKIYNDKRFWEKK